ncbi:MAG: hypothetical protein M3065_13860 [Actinomycetota bacterium]|nr:hypothetical protein [Actinomycetota bacterium]
MLQPVPVGTKFLSDAEELSEGWDVCIVHDPQPAALRALVPAKSRNWVWRCHIDLSNPNPVTLERLLPYLNEYPAAVFHSFTQSSMFRRVWMRAHK